ncbi:MAG: Crp/Fnr family transcriptional regulator [Rikenellaceae bacterium]
MNNLNFNYFCADCPESEEYRAANCFVNYRIRRYKRGDYVAYKGDRAAELTILVEGSVKTELLLESGIYYTSRQHTAPYPIGALAIFSAEASYRADIVALDECVVIAVARDDVEEQMSQCRRFMRSFIAYNGAKIDMFTRHLSILTHKSLKGRLSFYILTIAQGRRFRFDKRLEALATYLSVERPSLSRAIAQMVDEGVITYCRGEGEIVDMEALRELLD